MKKLIAFLLMSAMLLASLSLVGCNIDLSLDEPTDNGGGDATISGNQFDVEESLTYDGSEVTIKFYHTMGANLREVLENYIVEFVL